MKVYVVRDEHESTVQYLKRCAQAKFEQAKAWCDEHPCEIFILGTSGLTLVTSLVKGAIKRSNLEKQEAIKNMYCYDRSLGHYWKLRRELTNDEWLQVERRRNSGEHLADILESLRVLK